MTENARTQEQDRRSVVVGVDGSESSAHAAVWAAEEAERRGTALTVVHALNLPSTAVPPIQPAGYAERRHAEGTLLLDTAATALCARFPELTFDLELTDADPAHALVDFGRSAALLVTGTRGHGGFTGMLLGSVSRKLAAHAACPLVVVRGEPAPDAAGGVLLGVGAEHFSAPTRYAFETARLYGTPLTIVHAWWSDEMRTGMPGLGTMYVGSLEAARRRALAEVEDAVKPLSAEFPDVAVHIEVAEGNSVDALLRVAHDARLLVVGAQRRHAPLATGPGYVVDGVLAHSPVPVAVVPER